MAWLHHRIGPENLESPALMMGIPWGHGMFYIKWHDP
jgi:hypothetical protein